MKKILPIALVALQGCFMASASDFVVDNIDYGIYSEEENTVYVTWSSSSYSGDIVIPPTIEVDGETWTVTAIGDFAFISETGVTSVQLPETINRFGMAAFGYASGLTSIDIPTGVRHIGEGCFNGCTNLSSLEIPEALDYLGYGAFAYTAITSAVLPDGLTEIPSQLFEQCKDLQSVVIPEGVTTIGFQAFQNTLSLTEITFPTTLESIGNNCFAYSGLTSLHIPANFASYGDNALTHMSSLTEYSVDPENQFFTAKDGVLYSKDMTELHSFPLACGMTTYTVDPATTLIAPFAFYSTSLESIELPENLKTIGKSAFGEAVVLSEVVIPDNVETIEAYGFWACSGLKKITLGSSVSSIGEAAFSYITGLEKVISLNPEPPVGAAFTEEVYNNAVLSVPEEGAEAYSTAQGWSDFKTVETIENSGIAGLLTDNIRINLCGNTLEIECNPSAPVMVTDLNGTNAYEGSGSTVINLTTGNTYIVRIGNQTQKIFIR